MDQGVLIPQINRVSCCNSLSATVISMLFLYQAFVMAHSLPSGTLNHRPLLTGCLQASQLIHHCFVHEMSPVNTSDHLPISTILHIPVDRCLPHHSLLDPKTDWAKARNTGCICTYQELVSSVVYPLLGKIYDSPEQLNNEIVFVSQQLVKAVCHTLPTVSKTLKKKRWFKDQELSHLAALKKAAWDKWSCSGRPQSGPLYEDKVRSRGEFRKRLKLCAAQSERARIQKMIGISS